MSVPYCTYFLPPVIPYSYLYDTGPSEMNSGQALWLAPDLWGLDLLAN